MKLLLVVLGIAATLAIPDPKLKASWTDFKIKHNKQYASEYEESKRLQIFVDNLAEIEAHNARFKNGEVPYTKAMNKFGDLTSAEFLSTMSDYKWRNTTTPRRVHVMSGVQSDDTVDWRTKNAVTEVATEGECGASWAFSALGSVEGQLAIHTNQLVALSAQNLVDCSDAFGNAGCDGGLTNSAFDYIQSNGIESAADYPYQGAAGGCQFDASKSVTKISGYTDVNSDSEAGLQDAVANVGPVASAIHLSDNFQFYYGGVFLEDSCPSGQTDLDLGVLVIGYGREILYDYWLCKNSWGPDWGENGFFRIARNYGNNCGISTSAGYATL